MKQTRAKLTWYVVIAFTVLAIVGMIYGMEAVALAGIGGMTANVTTYHASQGYTKSQYIKANPTDKNLEG